MGSGSDDTGFKWSVEDVIHEQDYMLIPADYRLTNTVPFTYRDGYTYLEMLEEMRKWVSGGLKDNISNNFQNLAADYNTRINKLMGDVRTELEQYHVLPQQLKNLVYELVRKYDGEFRMFEETLTQWVKRQLERDHVRVFNPLRGETTDIDQFIFDLDNRVFVHGLLADDFSRYGMTAGEIDGLPMSVDELMTEGKNFLGHLFGQRVFSPVTGEYTSAQRAINSIFEVLCTGEGLLSSIAVDQISNMNISDIQNRKAA